MVAAAKRNRVEQYSITEHVSQFAELRRSVKFGSVHRSGRMFNSLAEYLDEFQKVDPKAQNLAKFNRGLEVDYSPPILDQVGGFVNRTHWDILLCSVHELRDGRAVEMKSRDDGTARWEEYIQLQISALESSFVPFDILSHPVRIFHGVRMIPENIDQMLFELCELAKKRGKALELNGSDIHYSPELVRRLASICSKVHCLVSTGSDAHYPRDVFRNMDVAMALVDEFELELIQTS